MRKSRPTSLIALVLALCSALPAAARDSAATAAAGDRATAVAPVSGNPSVSAGGNLAGTRVKAESTIDESMRRAAKCREGGAYRAGELFLRKALSDCAGLRAASMSQRIDLYCALATILCDQGKYKEAERYYRMAFAATGRDGIQAAARLTTLERMAVMYFSQGDCRKAIAIFARLIEEANSGGGLEDQKRLAAYGDVHAALSRNDPSAAKGLAGSQ